MPEFARDNVEQGFLNFFMPPPQLVLWTLVLPPPFRSPDCLMWPVQWCIVKQHKSNMKNKSQEPIHV
jgi:hypothetical protein